MPAEPHSTMSAIAHAANQPVEWVAAAGWFASLDPTKKALSVIIVVAVLGGGIGFWGGTTLLDRWRAYDDVGANEARITALEAVATQNRADIQAIITALSQAEGAIGDVRIMVNELFCDRFPVGSPSGIRCQPQPMTGRP